MKHLKTFEDFLYEYEAINELGDTEPLDWKLLKKDKYDYTYTFDLGPEEYLVTITPRYKNEINVAFTVDGYKDDMVTDSGYPLLVFSTVFDIVKGHIKEHPEVDTIMFVPSVNYAGDKRRLNIYLYYVKKNFPTASIKTENARSGYTSVEVKLK